MILAFYKGFNKNTSLLDVCISCLTFSKYSRVNMVFEDGVSIFSGSRLIMLDHKKQYNKDEWELISLPMSKESELRVYYRAIKYVGRRRSILGLFLSVLSIKVKDELMYDGEIVANSLFLNRGVYTPRKIYKLFSYDSTHETK